MQTGKRQMQFSKKIVVAVTVAVTFICVLAILLMHSIGQAQYMADIIKFYIAYAMIVFASYSSNSIAQKILLAKMPQIQINSNSTATKTTTTRTKKVQNG